MNWRSTASSPIACWLLSRALLTTGLTLKTSSIFFRLFISVAIFTVVVYAVIATESAGAVFIDWTLGHLLISDLLSASDFFILYGDPHREFKPARTDSTLEELRWEEKPLLERFKWTLSLSTSIRGIGWSHEPRKGILPPPRLVRSRGARILSLSLIIIRLLLLMLFNDVLIKMNPVFRFGSPGVRSAGMLWHLLACLSAGLTVYATFSVGHTVWELICVGMFRWGVPGEWRPLFGGIGEAWTVSQFWGVTWHQAMRRFLGAHGRFMAERVLRLRRGSLANRFVQIFGAFLFSALIHQTGEYMVAREHGKGWWNEGGGSFRFFMLQPAAIFIEQLLGFDSSNLKPSKRRRLVGYVWVLSWLYLTVPVWLDGAVRVGLMDQRVGLVFPERFNVLPEAWTQYR